MDVINEKEVFDRIVSPALDKINNETIPTAEKAIQRQVAAAASQFALMLADATVAFQTTADKLVTDLNRAIDRLDGVRLVDEIRIPPVQIQFKKAEP